MSKIKCTLCEGKGQVLNIGNYYTRCDKCNGTGIDRIKELEQQNEELLETIQNVHEYNKHNKDQVYMNAILKRVYKKITGKSIEEVLKDE